ncbi:hypothetical protein A2Y99_03130 [Candidatus Gottesmanbacteria bacterium RBG_13_37_7]|uniref:Glycosyl hydrolase family 98 putative carbohydrate-binding module domain-containing protein n=1 Tax=Candidatus Gottesmanbacteria bacterium RBG_13_37_7 TaxID=1798369 RepID=A0A1F5YH33_9BACT|nr:MAG: hypothetical protein A2Y99_03130 [Candidatus Gottesmanbacteria bacterium RBG_13_37_7]
MIPLIPILLIGLFIRFILIGNTGFIADISFWKSWSMAVVDHGVVWTAYNTNINYPPGFIYVLWIMGKIYQIFGNAHDYNAFWRENNFAFLFSSKLPAIAADVAVTLLIYWFLNQKEKLIKIGANLINFQFSIFPPLRRAGNFQFSLPTLMAAVFFLNPVSIIDSSLWGQYEAFGIFFTLISVVLLFYRRPYIGTVFFITGALLKLQNIIFIPLFFIFVFRYFDLETTLKSIAVAACTFFIVTFPFLVQGKMERVIYLMIVNNDYFPWLSLNAHNLWWIVAGAKGMTTTDKITVIGILNAKTVGLIIFSACYFLSCILIILRPTPRNFILALTIAIYSFFLFMTESHERYSYPVIVFLLFLYPFLENKINLTGIWMNSKKGRVPVKVFFWILYGFFTLAIFFNIHTGLILNYPYNGFSLLTGITNPVLTIANSYFGIFLFILLFPLIFSQISIFYLATSIALILFSLFALHLPYAVKKQVSLTSYKPIIIKQDYGTLQLNKTVNSFSGWRSWNRLSNNYFFYRKGFGTHANSKLVFDINRKFSRLVSDIGVDTETGPQASVVFQVFGDGKKLYESPHMGKFDFPGHIDIDIKGIKYLGLEITDAGNGNNNDHADWLNPVLYR